MYPVRHNSMFVLLLLYYWLLVSVSEVHHQANLMYVWPYIIYENDERYQLDATIM